MRTNFLILTMCLVAMAPGLVNAKKPQPEPDASCAVLVDSFITAGFQYQVKVVRVPSYPGAWRNPTITIEASYDYDSEIQPHIIKPNYFSVTYVTTSFVPPTPTTCNGSCGQMGNATIRATVEEPVKVRGKRNPFRRTTCEATTVVSY